MEARLNLEAARDSGVNLAFFSGNTGYFKVYLDPGIGGAPDRIMSKHHVFRLAGIDKPEEQLLGIRFEAGVTVLTQLSSPPTWPVLYPNIVPPSRWAYKDTGSQNGTPLASVMGYEYDRTCSNEYRPGDDPDGYLHADCQNPQDVVEVPAYGVDTTTADPPHPLRESRSTFYQTVKGAIVFAAGTINWSWGLDDYGSGDPEAQPLATAGLQQLTRNILKRMRDTDHVDVFGRGYDNSIWQIFPEKMAALVRGRGSAVKRQEKLTPFRH